MNLDEALMIASKDKGFSFGELHEAVDVLASEVKRLQVWNIRWRDFVKKQREEIQILSSEVTRLHDIEHQLHEAGDCDTWREACSRLEIQVKRFQDEIKQHAKDWCDDDEAIKQQALRVLPKESVEGDSFHVPRMGELAEMMADEIIKLRNNIEDSFNDLTIDQINTLYNSLCKEDCSKPTPKITVKSLPSKEENEALRINRQKNVYKKYKEGLEVYKTNTLCMNCNGVGYHVVVIRDNNNVPYTQHGYMTCEMCNGQGSL